MNLYHAKNPAISSFYSGDMTDIKILWSDFN